MLIDSFGCLRDSIAQNHASADAPRRFARRPAAREDAECCTPIRRRIAIANRWDDARAAGMSEPELLLYRSNLLGADKRVTNYGGGNTSAKLTRDRSADRREGRGALGEGLGRRSRLDQARRLRDALHGQAQRAEGPLSRRRARGRDGRAICRTRPSTSIRAPPRSTRRSTPSCPTSMSITCIPDAVIAIAASKNSRELTDEIYGDEIGWLPWKRPGFELGLWLEKFARENPKAKGCVLESHGLFTWADDAKACYELTLDVINRAIAWFERETAGKAIFGGEAVAAAAGRAAARDRRAADAGDPRAIGKDEPKVGHFDDSPAVLEFVGSKRLRELAALGTSCPDHFLRTKIWPLVLDFDPAGDNLDAGDRRTSTRRSTPIATDYAAYYERCKHADSPAMRDPNPVVYLVPGVGQITFARDKATARIAGEFYVNAINVMRGASTVSDLCRPARAGGLRHRILAARGGEAAAHAEAEKPRRQGRARHRRRRRHRPRHRRSGCSARAPASCSPTSTQTSLESTLEEFRASARSGLGSRRRARRDGRSGASRAPSPRRRSNTAASTSSSPTPASPPRRRSRTPSCPCGSGTWTSSRPAISWCRARPSG